MTDADILRSQIPASRTLSIGDHSKGRTIFSAPGNKHILTITHEGKIEFGDDFPRDDERAVAFLDVLRIVTARPVPAAGLADFRLAEATRHISKLTRFYMDNVLWSQVCERAAVFVKSLGSPAVAAPLTPDQPSSPATTHPNAIQQNAAANAPGDYSGVSGWQPIETAPRDGTWVFVFWRAFYDDESRQELGDVCLMARWTTNPRIENKAAEWRERGYLPSYFSPSDELDDYEYALIRNIPTHWMPERPDKLVTPPSPPATDFAGVSG